MREIKFRVWDNNSNCYQVMAASMNVHTGQISDLPERFILEQYTGLKDNNGREIYEGDIVKLDEIWEDQRYGVIEYNPYEGFGIYYKDRGYDCASFLNMHYFYELDICEMRVVCSKHENPELIEEV